MSPRWPERLQFAFQYTGQQFRTHKLRLGMAVCGVAIAVLAVTLLAGTGIGVLETGDQQFDRADRDLWITADETQIQLGSGGFTNSITDARTLAHAIQSREAVQTATPLAFQTVYAGPSPGEGLQTFVGVGVPGGSSLVQVTDGRDLEGDPHYADGSYNGTRTYDVVLDGETADQLGVGVGDTIYVGRTLQAAEDNAFTVVGISPTYERMLGTPTVTMPLSELHEVTGTTASEPATFITVTVSDEASVETVQADLQAAYPSYSVRTNQQQLQAVLDQQLLIVVAGGTLILLAFVGGVALTFALLSVVIYQQQDALLALTAQGLSTPALLTAVITQGVTIGVVGGVVGVVVTIPGVQLLNILTSHVVGFSGLVQLRLWIVLAGLTVAVCIGMIAALLAGRRVAATSLTRLL